MKHICSRSYNILCAVFYFLRSCAEKRAILTYTRGFAAKYLATQTFNLVVDAWLLFCDVSISLFMVVNLYRCTLHTDSSFAHFGLLSKVGTALIGIYFLGGVMKAQNISQFFLES